MGTAFCMHKRSETYTCLFSGKIPAIESIWIVGDEFVDCSFTAYFKHVRKTDDNRIYTTNHFDVFDYSTTQYCSSLRNILARYLLLIGKAIREKTLLPKAIVIVPDDDIIRQSPFTKYDAQQGYDVILSFLMKEIHQMILPYKDKLPVKCKTEFFPHVIWISLPDHKYFPNRWLHREFANSLDCTVANFNKMCVLKLKKIWDPEDSNCYSYSQRRFMPEGLHSYWLAVDRQLNFGTELFTKFL